MPPLSHARVNLPAVKNSFLVTQLVSPCLARGCSRERPNGPCAIMRKCPPWRFRRGKKADLFTKLRRSIQTQSGKCWIMLDSSKWCVYNVVDFARDHGPPLQWSRSRRRFGTEELASVFFAPIFGRWREWVELSNTSGAGLSKPNCFSFSAAVQQDVQHQQVAQPIEGHVPQSEEEIGHLPDIMT